MKRLFYLYSFLYLVFSLEIKFGEFSVFVTHLLVALSYWSLLIPAGGFFIAILYPSLIKSNREDPTYLSLCAAATVFRILFMGLGILGIRDQILLLFLNSFGLVIFSFIFLKMSKYKPKEYYID